MEKYEGVDYFWDWPDRHFLPWLAGFFDGEGCVYMKPGQIGIEVSIVNTDLDAIHAIHKRLGFGEVEVQREAGPRNKKSIYWRARKMHEVRKFLIMVRPYLTVKATRADRAIRRIVESVKRQLDLAEREKIIRQMRAEGLSQYAIATRLGMTRTNVSRILCRKTPAARPLL
jgi:hypothetical protein